MDIEIIKKDIILLKQTDFNTLDDLNNSKLLEKYFDIPNGQMTCFDHIFAGRQDNGDVVGYHSEFLFPNRYTQNDLDINLHLDKTKPYNLILPCGKTTSCFPNDLNINELISIILSSYRQSWIEQPPKNLKTTCWNPITYSPELDANIQLKTGVRQKIYDAYPLVH